MQRSSTSLGLFIATIAAASFGMSGAFIKPLLESGWSPAAAVTFRALIGGVVLLPFALFSLRGRWGALWRARWRVLPMGTIGVAATQLVYFAAIKRVPVSTAILIEYMAPLLLVIVAWARSRRMPRSVVLVGSIVSLAGLVLVVAPDGRGNIDVLGLVFAAGAAVGCAVYYVLAARPSDGLSPVALASSGLVLGGVCLGLAALGGSALRVFGVPDTVPWAAPLHDVAIVGTMAPWWVPLVIVGTVATGIAYATSIAATEMLGSRLSSFMGLLEVVAAAIYAWVLLGESLTLWQLIGGVLILAGIAFVRSEKVGTSVKLGESEKPVWSASSSTVSLEPGFELVAEQTVTDQSAVVPDGISMPSGGGPVDARP